MAYAKKVKSCNPWDNSPIHLVPQRGLFFLCPFYPGQIGAGARDLFSCLNGMFEFVICTKVRFDTAFRRLCIKKCRTLQRLVHGCNSCDLAHSLHFG